MFPRTPLGCLFIALRALAISTLVFGVSALLCIPAAWAPFHTRYARYFQRWVCRNAVRILALKKEVRGCESFVHQMPCVFIANHQSLLDLFLLAEVIPEEVLVVGKKGLGRIPVFGWLFYWCGFPLLDRENPERAVDSLKALAERLKREGKSAVIFPEGTRSLGRGINPFKTGAFYLARDAGLPIQPLVVSSYRRTADFNQRNPGAILFQGLPLIPWKRLAEASSLKTLADETRSTMKEQLVALDQEIERKTK